MLGCFSQPLLPDPAKFSFQLVRPFFVLGDLLLEILVGVLRTRQFGLNQVGRHSFPLRLEFLQLCGPCIVGLAGCIDVLFESDVGFVLPVVVEIFPQSLYFLL